MTELANPKQSEPTLCIDFDGVIHRYSQGWGDGSIYDGATTGFFDWAARAAHLFRLVVYSSRSKHPSGSFDMMRWMQAQAEKEQWSALALVVSVAITEEPYIILARGSQRIRFEFTDRKPAAFLTIDDRAIQFRGDWSASQMQPDALITYRPWTQNGEADIDYRKLLVNYLRSLHDQQPPTSWGTLRAAIPARTAQEVAAWEAVLREAYGE